jgi:hypothetical protein
MAAGVTATVDIDFAGGPYRLEGLTAGQARVVRDHFGPLCAGGGGEPAVTAVVRPLDRDEHIPETTRGWEYRLDLAYQATRVSFAGWGIAAHVDVPVTRGALATTAGESDRLPGVVENFLRVVAAYRMLACGGALLHSAGIVDGGRAFVFFGESGAGKTTLSTHSAQTGREVLSDELNALWRDRDGGARVEKLPFAGDFGGPPGARAVYPAAAVFRLSQAPRTEIVSMSSAEALGAMVAASPFVNGDPHRNALLLDNLHALAQATPVHHLRVALGESPWDILT